MNDVRDIWLQPTASGHVAWLGAGDDVITLWPHRAHAPRRVFQIMPARITSVAAHGFFAELDGGTPAFMPASKAKMREGEKITARVVKDAWQHKPCEIALAKPTDRAPPETAPWLHFFSPTHTLRLHSSNPELLKSVGSACAAWGVACESFFKLGGDVPSEWQNQFDDAFEPSIKLAGGVSIHVHLTEAACLIDVDGSVDASALNTNLVAARAVMRLLRLRHIGGLIAVDFLRVDKTARDKLIAQIKPQAAVDELRPTVLGFTKGGLLEIQRPRTGAALMKSDVA